MLKQYLVIVASALFFSVNSSYALDREDCHELYDIYSICYKGGLEINSLDVCKEVADDMYDEMLEESTSRIEDAISETIANVCDMGCRDAVDNYEKATYREFRSDECR